MNPTDFFVRKRFDKFDNIHIIFVSHKLAFFYVVTVLRTSKSKMWKNRFQCNIEKYILQKTDELQMEIERFSKLDALR